MDQSVEVGSEVRSEAVKHRQAVASVISSVAVAVLYAVVSVDVINTLGLPVGSLVAPATVLGAAFGFGAQRIVQDLLSWFFIITEKQYGFGDLVQLTIRVLERGAWHRGGRHAARHQTPDR